MHRCRGLRRFYVLTDPGLKFFLLAIRNDLGADLAAALKDADYDSFPFLQCQ